MLGEVTGGSIEWTSQTGSWSLVGDQVGEARNMLLGPRKSIVKAGKFMKLKKSLAPKYKVQMDTIVLVTFLRALYRQTIDKDKYVKSMSFGQSTLLVFPQLQYYSKISP